MDEKRSYTVKELQEILQVSRPAVYELLKQKQFEWVVVGGKYLNFLYILTLSQPEGFRLPRYYQSTYSELVTNFNIHRR